MVVMETVVTETAVTETVVMEMMRMMRNDENSGNSEGMISDDDMNWSGVVCSMSLIITVFCVSYIVHLLGQFTGFLYYCVSI
jgi:hypothetical protein